MTSRLADHLRSLTDDGLGELLARRPDLVVPVPTDIGQLASRVQSRASVGRALEGLDQFTLEMLDGLRFVRAPDGSASVQTLLTLTAEAGVEAAAARAAVHRLRDLTLIYGPDEAVYLVGAVE